MSKNLAELYTSLIGRYIPLTSITPPPKLGLVVDPVIEAIASLEFEDDFSPGVLLGGYWYPCGSSI